MTRTGKPEASIPTECDIVLLEKGQEGCTIGVYAGGGRAGHWVMEKMIVPYPFFREGDQFTAVVSGSFLTRWRRALG